LSSKKPKLLYILASIDDAEFKSLKKYILRYTGKDSDNAALLEYLYKVRKKISTLTLQDVHKDHFAKMSLKAVQNLFNCIL